MIENKPALAEKEKGRPDLAQALDADLSGWVNQRLASIIRMPFFGWIALFYLAAITLAEGLTTLVSPQVGLILHGLILLALLLEAAFSERKFTRRFLLALALAPLTRLMSLVLPLQHFPLAYWYLLVGLPLGISAVVAARVERFSAKELGLTAHDLPFQVLISLSGIGLGAIEYLILRPKPLVTVLRLELIWLPALILLIFTGLLEEFIFRGLIQSAALRKLGRGGIVYSALLFAVLHMGYKSWLDGLFVFAVALFFSWAVRSSGSILGATLAHGLTNIGLFLVFPFVLALPVIPQTGPIDAATPVMMASATLPPTEAPQPNGGVVQATPGLLPQNPTPTPFMPHAMPVLPVTAPAQIPTANWVTLTAAPPEKPHD